jgi:hypothetical protein
MYYYSAILRPSPGSGTRNPGRQEHGRRPWRRDNNWLFRTRAKNQNEHDRSSAGLSPQARKMNKHAEISKESQEFPVQFRGPNSIDHAVNAAPRIVVIAGQPGPKLDMTATRAVWQAPADGLRKP